MRNVISRLPLGLAGLVAVAAAAALSAKEPPPAVSGVRVEAAASSPVPAAGWRAFRDPKTGKLRAPTPEEASELSRRATRKSAAPVAFEVVVHPDGMKSVDLKGAFSMSLVARRNADGSIAYECRPPAATRPKTASPARAAENR